MVFKIAIKLDGIERPILKETEAATFGQACYKIEKTLLRECKTPISFTHIKQKNDNS